MDGITGEHVPGSAYARQLEQGFPWLRFLPELEEEFRAGHYRQILTPVRAALFVGLVLTGLFFLLGVISGRSYSDPVASFIRFGVLAPALLVAIVYSYLPERRDRFPKVVAAVAGIIAGAYVGLNLSSPAALLDLHFAALPVVVAFIYFALGLFMRTAFVIVLAMTLAYVILAGLMGMPGESLGYKLAVLVVANFICGIGSYVLEYALRVSFLERRLLEQMVERDGLTGLLNRRAFDRQMERAWALARRQQKALAVLMADIDCFKSFNDRRGHQAGDDCLRQVARCVAAAARRPLDLAGRYGGEEFILLLYDVDFEGAVQVADELRRRVAGQKIPHGASSVAPVITISVGVAAVSPAETARSLRGIIQLADQCLYQAKDGGRNQVIAEEAAEAYIETGVFESA